jgi:hypothetical protein
VRQDGKADPALPAVSAKLKVLLRKATQRSVDDLSGPMGVITDLFIPAECADDFASADDGPS